MLRDPARASGSATRLADGEQPGHVGARLGGQVQMPEIGGLAMAAVHAMACSRCRCRVVGGDRQQPVAVEFIVQRLQVVQRRAGGVGHVAAAVVPPVLLQLVRGRCRERTATDPRRGRRNRRRDRRRSRPPAAARCPTASCALPPVDDVVHVGAGRAGYPVQVFAVGGEPVELALHMAVTGSPSSAGVKCCARYRHRSSYCGSAGLRVRSLHSRGTGVASFGVQVRDRRAAESGRSRRRGGRGRRGAGDGGGRRGATPVFTGAAAQP